MIYLDHAATTSVHPEVLKTMYEYEQDNLGNPSSTHAFGRKAKLFLNQSRRFLAESIQAAETDIIFTSGGTEANNLAIIGTALENEHNGNHIITTLQEHHAILGVMDFLQKKGFQVTYLPVNKEGQINPYDLERSLTDNTTLVSIMMANNETGVKQPIKEVSEILQNHQAFLHTDAVQAYGLMDIDVEDLQVDLLTTSAHKLNGPKGIGFLYKKSDVPMQQLQYGGYQEFVKRPGTENLTGIIGYQKAVEIALENQASNVERYERFKQLFIETLKKEEIEFSINGDITKTIPTIVNVSFPNTTTEVLLTNFDLDGVAAASGSACTSGTLDPSHVLKAMYRFQDERINNSVRFSFGEENDEENIVEAARKVAKVVKRLTNGEGR